MYRNRIIRYFHLWGILMLLGYSTTYPQGGAVKNYASDKPKWFWGFDKWNDPEGWTCPEVLNGTVTGGTLWLIIQSE
ncbi:MAG: hypothetical protein RBS73_15515 [Prolixibacteraceae bacterium]|nr:hypothetical protein [Prolixibacteraceae bacterium]